MKALHITGVLAALCLTSAFATAQQTDERSPPPSETMQPPSTGTPPDAMRERSDRGDRSDRRDRSERPTDQDRASARATEMTGPADNQIANEVDARIARLKASLQLTVEQERSWPGIQSTLHDYGIEKFRELARNNEARRGSRRNSAEKVEQPDDIALMRREAESLQKGADAMKKLADAAEPLYGALNERQRRLLIRFISSEFDR